MWLCAQPHTLDVNARYRTGPMMKPMNCYFDAYPAAPIATIRCCSVGIRCPNIDIPMGIYLYTYKRRERREAKDDKA